jgi:ATP-dependent helicase/nuclease subunit A
LVARHTRKQGGTLFTPEAIEFSREANARETAERRRLTYVAMTRARERLFLLAPPLALPGSAAATLRRLLPELSTRCRDVVVDAALPYLAREPVALPLAAVPSPDLPSFVRRQESDRGPLSISTTSLATFDQCPRRYRLIHEMAIEPPRGASDARRAIGMAAHRVLERWPLVRWGTPTSPQEMIELLAKEGVSAVDESTRRIAANMAEFLAGSYAARVRRARRVHREASFVVRLGSEPDVLSLRGTIDLLAQFDDRSADIVDYKSSWRAGAAVHDFQLYAYALAARDRFGIGPVRLSIVNLGSSSEPEVVGCPEPAELVQFESRLRALRARFTVARASDHFAGIERRRCEALRCGFVPLCHPETERI